jgi:hypothetical protein
MKNKKTTHKTIAFLNMGNYPGTVMFSVGFTQPELIKQLQKNYKTGYWKPEQGCENWLRGIEKDDLLKGGVWFALQRKLYHKKHPAKNLFYILILRPFDFSDGDMCKLAHECLHICQFFLPDILDRNKEYEAEAYLHTHLMSQCLRIMRKEFAKSKK